jgi:hypothetical protein
MTFLVESKTQTSLRTRGEAMSLCSRLVISCPAGLFGKQPGKSLGSGACMRYATGHQPQKESADRRKDKEV